METAEKQTRYLNDADKCKIIESKFGTIIGKYVLYRCEDTIVGDMQYLNVEQFLCDLK